MARGMSPTTTEKGTAAQLSPRKKSGRSQSPRAMERRRLQNRIAQRNHRRRLKEGAYLEEERVPRSPSDGDAADRQQSARLGTPVPDDSPTQQSQQQHYHHQQPSPSSQTQSPSPILAPLELEAMGVHPHDGLMKSVGAHDGMPWNFDLMMAGHMAGGGGGGGGSGGDAFGSPPQPSPFFFPGVQQACSCNGLTGPCARHMEEMRHRFMNLETGGMSPYMSPPPRADAGPAPMPMDPSPMMLHSMASYEDVATHVPPPTIPPPPPQQQQQHMPPHYHHQPSPKSRYVVHPWHGSDGSGSSLAPSSSTGRHSSSAGLSSSSPQGVASDGGFLAGLVGGNAAANEASSSSAAPSAASASASASASSSSSVASDTARFNTILEVVRNAGFADFDRMVTAYYTAHFDRGSRPDLLQRASRSRRLRCVLADLHAASARWNAWEARGFHDGVAACARQMCAGEMDKIAPFHPLHPADAGMDGLGLASPLLALPDHMETVVQSESPYLWSLLTELAGPQGLYCDRVAQSALALLLHARRNQA